MPATRSLSVFTKWLIEIGVPEDCTPNGEALARILKSKQCDQLLNIVQKIHSCRLVKATRANRLLSKIDQHEKLFNPICAKSYVDIRAQRVRTVEELKTETLKFERRLTSLETDVEKLYSSIRIINSSKFELQNQLNSSKLKSNILKVKIWTLMNIISDENANRSRITSSLLSSFKMAEGNCVDTVNLVEQAIKCLNSNCSAVFSLDTQVIMDLCNTLRGIFANISNYELWKILISSYEAELQKICNAAKLDFTISTSAVERSTLLERNISKTTTYLFKIVQEFIEEKTKTQKLKDSFLSIHNVFSHSVQLRINVLNIQNENIKDDMAQYVIENNTKCYNKSQIEFMSKTTAMRKERNFNKTMAKKGHDDLLNAARKVYNEINETAIRISQEASQLAKVKEKINYNRKVILYIYHQAQNKYKKSTMKFGISTDSFELSDALCSTKLDIESSITVIRLESNAPKCINHHVQYMGEILVFTDLWNEQLYFPLKRNLFSIGWKQFPINYSDTDAVLNISKITLTTNDFFLDSSMNTFLWNNSLREYSSCANGNWSTDWCHPAFNLFIRKERIVELLDKNTDVGIKIKQMIEKINKYYAAIVSNTLHGYIPPTKIFNNRSYLDYELEYITYCCISSNHS